MRELAEGLAAHADSTPVWKAVHAATRGGVAALEGRSGDAAIEHGEANRSWRKGGYEFEAASAALDFAWAVSPEVPQVRLAADEARAVFERVRAEVYLDRLDAVMAGATDVALNTNRAAPVAAHAPDP